VEKNVSFGLVGKDSIVVLSLKVFNLVFPQPARSAEVEIAGVLVSQGAVFLS
jgi:hypothetical protein